MGNSALSGLIIPVLWIGGMVVVLSLIKLFGKKRNDSGDADDLPPPQ